MLEFSIMTDLEPSIIPTRKPYQLMTDEGKAKIVAFVRENGRYLGLMAQVAGVSKETLRQHMKEDLEFAGEIEDAIEARNRHLEEAAYKRAVKGVIRRKYDKDGNLIEKERVYSDRLLEKLLDANHPDKFRRDKDQGVGGPIGGVLVIPLVAQPMTTDPSEISKRLNELSSLQDRLQEDGEKRME